MPMPRLQIYLQPRVTLTFHLFHPMGKYHNTCLPGLVTIRRTVLEISRRKECLWPFGLDLRPPDPESWSFTTGANWHQNWFICFQNTMFTSLVTDKQTDGWTNGMVWHSRV